MIDLSFWFYLIYRVLRYVGFWVAVFVGLLFVDVRLDLLLESFDVG
jgi:hypothetical protein